MGKKIFTILQLKNFVYLNPMSTMSDISEISKVSGYATRPLYINLVSSRENLELLLTANISDGRL